MFLRRLIFPPSSIVRAEVGRGEDEVSYGDSNLRGWSAGRHNFFLWLSYVKELWQSFRMLFR